MRPALVRLALVAGAVLVAAFIAFRLVSVAGDLDAVPAVERPGLIAAATLLYAASMLLLALVWREIVARLNSARAPLVPTLAVFCASWLGRYVPSSLPYVAGKFAMGRRLGFSAGALAASVLYENVIVVCVGLAASCALLPLLLTDGGGPLLYATCGLAGASGLAMLAPPVLTRLLRGAAGIARRSLPEELGLLSYRDIAAVAALAVAALAVNGLTFACLLAAFSDLSLREAAAAAAVYDLAGVLGILVLPVPSGLGVREAVLVGLLQVFVPVPVAAAAAVLVRLIGITVDLTLGAAGAAVFALSQRERDATPVARERPLDLAS